MNQSTHNRLEELIFATTNVQYLRGCTMLPVGLLFVAFPLLPHFAKTQPLFAFSGLLAGAAIVISLTVEINRHYDEYYGRVEPGSWKRFPAVGLAVWGGVAVTLMSTGRDREAALWVGAFFWGIYMTSSGYRWFYLPVAVAFASISPFWGNLSDAWKTAGLGLALLGTSLADHFLLRKLLLSKREEEATPGVS